jgi:surfeit locus 1 family protein
LPANPKLPIVATIVTFVVVVIMFALGYWQLQRAEFKEARLQQIDLRKQSSPFLPKELLAMGAEQDIRDFPVTSEGYFLQESYFLRDNSIQHGNVGYEVIVPFVSESGLLLVNLGWVAGSEYREQLPIISIPDGVIRVDGIVSVPDLNPLVSETALADDVWPKRIQQVDLVIMAKLLNKPLLPMMVLLEPSSPIGFERNWQAVVMPPEKHLAYAVQWFGLGMAAIVVFGFRLKAKFTRKQDE